MEVQDELQMVVLPHKKEDPAGRVEEHSVPLLQYFVSVFVL